MHKTFKNIKLKNLLWKAAYIVTWKDFQLVFQKIKKLKPEYADWFVDLADLKQWCQFWLGQTRIFEYSMSNRGFVKSFVFIDLQTQIRDSSSNIRTFDVEIET